MNQNMYQAEPHMHSRHTSHYPLSSTYHKCRCSCACVGEACACVHKYIHAHIHTYTYKYVHTHARTHAHRERERHTQQLTPTYAHGISIHHHHHHQTTPPPLPPPMGVASCVDCKPSADNRDFVTRIRARPRAQQRSRRGWFGGIPGY